MLKHLLWFMMLCLLPWEHTEGAEAVTPKRQTLLDQILRVLPNSAEWERWQKSTGELPPDFDLQPGYPGLPDPLRFVNGKEVKLEDWPKRRQELLQLFQRYLVGKAPPSPSQVQPGAIESREESSAFIDEITLEFGPEFRARLRMELIIPRGGGLFPVLLTPAQHRNWALVAVSRGYIGAVFSADDERDDTTDWPKIWPGLDWSKLMRRAWAASRCVDYLQTLPVVDSNRIAVAGHALNGKTALIAAAFDRRINAVIASSSGAGGACSFRLFSEAEFGEGIELLTRLHPDWFHPRLRFFTGREHKLPIDQSALIACIAPRSCLLASAVDDPAENLWAIEQTYHSARRAYSLLGRPQELNLRYRTDGHRITTEEIESYLDWLDTVFGLGDFPVPDVVVFPTYDQWLHLSGEQIDPKTYDTNSYSKLLSGPQEKPIITPEEWVQRRPQLLDRLSWALGDSPPFAESRSGASAGLPARPADLPDPNAVPADIQKQRLSFGNALTGDLYLPADTEEAGKPLPAVIWLHPFSTAAGYAPPAHVTPPPHLALARKGFAVFAFDQIGHGSRLLEVKKFYLRYPQWSLLGKSVEDTLAAVEALVRVPGVDRRRIYLLGFGMGGAVALHAAAIDERIAGVVSVAGFTPLRLDTLEKGTGELARWSRWLPWQPRLGAFIGQENRVPYDYHEVLALIAPRPATIIAPTLDYRANLAGVRQCVQAAAEVYQLFEAKDRLRLEEPEDYHRFSPALARSALEALQRMAGR